MVLSLFVNNPDLALENSGITSLEFLGGYLLARSFIQTTEDFIALCKFFLKVSIIIFPAAIFETVTGNPIILQILDSLPGIRTESFGGSNTRFGLHRVHLTFTHPILYGIALAPLLAFVFVSLKEKVNNSTRWLGGAAVCVNAGLSLSSGPILSLVIQIFLIFWNWLLIKIRRRWWLLTGLCFLAYFAVDILSSRSPVRVFLSYATFSPHTAYTRLHIFDWGLINISANPIFGLGFRDWVRPEYMGSSVDNFWLLTAMRYGIPGFAFLAGGWVTLMFQVARRNFDANPSLSSCRQAWMIAMIAMIFCLTTVHIWGAIFSFYFFLVGTGAWMVNASEKDTKVTNTTSKKPYPYEKSPYTRFPSTGGGRHR
nr:O-antigen ligase family protein [uncultured Shimia sp.]